MIDQIGHYKIIRSLGKGGMAEVFEVYSLENPLCRYALKRSISHQFDKRWIVEVEALRKVNHPNVIRMVDCDPNGNFIIMEKMDYSLEYRMNNKFLSFTQAAEILYDIACALSELSQKGIVHRDITPRNVLMSIDGSIKLADFGLAKILNEDLSCSQRTVGITGSLPYMSPEQIRNGRLDVRSDLFSLGAVFYEILCYKQPFQNPEPGCIIEAILTKQILPPRKLNPLIPASLSHITMKLLQKEPNRRYQSPDDLIKHLEKVGIKRMNKNMIQTIISRLNNKLVAS